MTGNEAEDALARFRKMSKPVRLIYGRPRTFFAIAVGILAYALLPGSLRQVTRALLGWDICIAVYLLLVFIMVVRSGLTHIKRNAALQDDGRFVILMVAAHHSAAALTLATVTIALSWAAVHTIFALHYAHEFYRGAKPGGLQFPSGDQHETADYWDFVYFSFVIGTTAQVSDVGITDKTIRRTATAHGIVSFIYNTALVALMVNIAASAI